MIRHSLFCGVTQSGKTTLARYICRGLLAQGQAAVVFDPVGTQTLGGGWGESHNLRLFNDAGKFLEYMADERVTKCHVFVDESDELFNLSRRENFWMLTRGRHFELSMNVIACRPKLLAPSVRRQCTRLYMFRLAVDDRNEIGRDFGHDDFAAYNLDAGEFVISDSGSRDVKTANLRQLLEKEVT